MTSEIDGQPTSGDATDPANPEPRRAVTRRRLLGAAALGTAAAGAGAVAATALERSRERPASPRSAASAATAATVVDPHGVNQAGVARPVTPPSSLRLIVADLRAGTRPGPLLAALGRTISLLGTARHPQLAGIPAARLTVAVAIGPRLVATAGATLPGAEDLPTFSSDRLVSDEHRGGDLAIQVAADDPVLVTMASTVLTTQLADSCRIRWTQDAFRGPAVGTAARNVVGFVDGISVPHGNEELAEQVWLPAPASVVGGTILALRRFRIDVGRFTSLTTRDQEAAIGRRRADSAPLSGGSSASDPDLGAKTPDGQYRIPALAHVRRAHPLTVGAGLMLRRSYSIAGDGAGLLFLSYQRDLRTFVATQQRLDDGDALLAYAHADASATFLVLPGFTTRRALGASVFA